MQYKATCTKGNQKLILSLQANNIDEARSILHGQGYSIMDIQEFTQVESGNLNFFYFDANVNGLIKTGKIQSNDIFKAYKKLVEDLNYNIIYIYTSEGMNEEQKKLITSKVKDGYHLYQQSIGIEKDNTKIKTEKEEDLIGISPQVLKEIAQYNEIIDSTVEKIHNLSIKYHNTITPEKKKQLEELEMNLVQAKGMSNLGRLRNIIEQGLTLIGGLEKGLIQGGMEGEKKRLLEETNDLLKQVGSSNRIDVTGDDDIGKKITQFFEKIQKKQEEKPQEEQKKKIDTNSFIFYRNLRELNIYKENMRATQIKIVKALFSFQFRDLKRLLLKRKLLSQNITIIDNRIHNRNISYTKVVKGAQYYFNLTFLFFEKTADILLYTLFLYTLTYITLTSLNSFNIIHITIESRFFFYITLISVVTFSFSFIRSLFSIVLMHAFLLVMFIFLSVNF
ncbi:MAG: hypothetical protein PHY14_04370 [Candidatus Gracilibacteria bacterium]|nr:hypothetical protein [Candidatus Gracilibacteria bacterium]